jgi:uncharacterized membrane protein YphA (DoxX/SURF4 family)
MADGWGGVNNIHFDENLAATLLKKATDKMFNALAVKNHEPSVLAHWGLFASRLILGGLFIWSSISKITAPYEFLSAVYGFEVVGREVGVVVAVAVPWCEFAIGVCLLAGVLLDGAFALSAVMLAIFAILLTFARANGLEVACNCFGSDRVSVISTFDVLRTVGLLALAVTGLTLSLRQRPQVSDTAISH